VRVFDGARTLGTRDVLVRDGHIATIGETVPAPAGAVVVDGTGRTLLPGLIDAHTHAFGDALEQALAFGVTTELDMFSDPATDARLRAEQRAGPVASRADLYSAGVLVTAPKGHGTEYGFAIPTLGTPDSAQAFVDARLAEGADYVKIVYDDGTAYGRAIPTLARATLGAVVRAAHARGKLAVVHTGTLADARAAIDAGADGLEHLFVDRAPDPAFGAHHAFVVPTLTVLRSVTGTSGAGDLAADPRLAPYLAGSGRATVGGAFPVPPGSPPRTYAAAEAAVRQLRAAHVPILAGTDAPNPGTAHGIALHRELELLLGAGLTPAEALAAATSVPARMKSGFGFGWVISTDQFAGGTSTATMAVVDSGANGSTAARAIHSWARGDGRAYQVMVFAESRGRIPLTRPFVAGPAWQEYTLPLASFGGIDGHDVMGIAFTGGPTPGPYRFRIDEVRVE